MKTMLYGILLVVGLFGVSSVTIGAPTTYSPNHFTPVSLTVYTTNTGHKYHNGYCRYLKQSKIAISLDEAKRRGLTACSVCNPPR